MELSKNKVLLGLSGGVDSATAALLLKEKGFEVTGYYFDVSGSNVQGRKEACDIAEQLGIPLIVEDVSDAFRNIVISNFIDEYLHGRTPNPCIICNPNIKFRHLIEKADEIGAYYIATGHYCRIGSDEFPSPHIECGKQTYTEEQQENRWNTYYYIQRAANDKKDQSYMLYRLGQNVLSRLIFPLGQFLSKDETRRLARENHLDNAEKKDSQEICFISPDENYIQYIQEAGYSSKLGNFVDKDGNVLGTHQGILHYTIGQRKGLGIALGKPAFVTDIHYTRNEIVLGDNDDLFENEVFSGNNCFAFGVPADYDGKQVLAKVRYSAPPSQAVLHVEGDQIRTVFLQKQRAITPGQSIVFYDGDKLLGGGFIEKGNLPV